MNGALQRALARTVHREMTARGWSQNELARRTGLLPQYVSQDFGGGSRGRGRRRMPGIRSLKRCQDYARAFGWPISELFTRSEVHNRKRPNLDTHPDVLALGAAVRAERLRQRLSMQALAHRSRVALRTIEALEQGYGDRPSKPVGAPLLTTVQALARGLGMPASELLASAERLQPQRAEAAE